MRARNQDKVALFALRTSGNGKLFMASRKRSRQQGDPSERLPLIKRVKPNISPGLGGHLPPAQYWDALSQVHLTKGALRECDSRQRKSCDPTYNYHPTTDASVYKVTQGLQRFASHGGPDITDLRGYRHPRRAFAPKTMSSRQSTQSGLSLSAVASTRPTSASTTSRRSRSTVYSRNFDQHLTDHTVYPVYFSEEPTNLNSNSAQLAQPRSSLSPTQFSESAFRAFQRDNAQAKDEADIEANILPTLLGTARTRHLTARNTLFGNLEPLTDGTIAPAKPDMYSGASPTELCRAVRDQLGHLVIPSSMQDKPLAPNYFIEAKGPDGSFAVANRQARYDGAIGSRAMHSLRNYGREKEVYTSDAYTFSSIYHGGTLTMFTHHLAGPNERGMHDYHMTQVGAWAVTGDRDSFVRGAGALRNAQDLAKRYRDDLIQVANKNALDHLTGTSLIDDTQCVFPGTPEDNHSKRPRPPGSPEINERPTKNRRPLEAQWQDSLFVPPDTGQLWVDTYWQDGCICFSLGAEVLLTKPKDWMLDTREDGRFCFRLIQPRGQCVRTKGLNAQGEQDT